MLYFHHPSSQAHDPRVWSPEHPDSPERIAAIEALMDETGWSGCEVRSAPAATEDQLRLVHAPELIERIRSLSLSGGGQIDPETFVGTNSYVAALHAAGGAGAMVRALLAGEAATAFCGLRPSGHHAEDGRAMGFCLFNNIAIAAQLAITELGVERVMIIDWDVHHGNGTAEIFRRRSDVLFASIHQSGLYPGTGAIADVGSGDGSGYTINIPVPAGSAGDVWISLLEYVILPAALAFRPQLFLISAGFDAHRDDPLGGCALDADAFAQMACHVRDTAASIGAPVGAVLEGGYDLDGLAASVRATVSALSGVGQAQSNAPEMIFTPRAAARIGHYWEL